MLLLTNALRVLELYSAEVNMMEYIYPSLGLYHTPYPLPLSLPIVSPVSTIFIIPISPLYTRLFLMRQSSLFYCWLSLFCIANLNFGPTQATFHMHHVLGYFRLQLNPFCGVQRYKP